MKKHIIYLLTLLSLVSCIKEKQNGADLVVGDRIPDFSVTMNDGTEVTSAQLSQGTAVIVFFTTACSDCQQTLPHIQDLYNAYLSEGVKFVLISREEGIWSIEKYWKENALTLPYSAQKDRTVYELFAKTRVPRVYIIKNGIIKSIHTDDPIPTYDALAVLLTELVRSQNKFKVGNFPAFSFGVR